VGLSFVKFGRLLGLGWIGAVDPVPSKRELALSKGADAAFAPDSPKLAQLAASRGRTLAAVIDAVGSAQIVNAGLPLVRMGGAVCVYGVIAGSRLDLDKAAGPYNFNLFLHQWPTRWRERQAQTPLCEWIRQGKLEAAEYVTHRFPVEQIADAWLPCAAARWSSVF